MSIRGMHKLLLRSIPPLMTAVGVFVERPFRQVAAMAYQLGLRSVQIHGEPREIADPFPFSLIAAFRVKDRQALDEITAYLDRCRANGHLPGAILVDAFVEGRTWRHRADCPLGIAGRLKVGCARSFLLAD